MMKNAFSYWKKLDFQLERKCVLWNLRGIWNMDNFHFFKGIFAIFMWKMRRNNAKNNSMDLLQFCKVPKEKNSTFQYAYTTNEENRLEHIFWSPTHCFDWYQKMEMWLFFILIRWMLVICLLVFLLVSIIMER